MFRCSRTLFEQIHRNWHELQYAKFYIYTQGMNDEFGWYLFNSEEEKKCSIPIDGEYTEIFLPESRMIINYIWRAREVEPTKLLQSRFEKDFTYEGRPKTVRVIERGNYNGCEYCQFWYMSLEEYNLIPEELRTP